MEINISTDSWHCRLLDFKDKYFDYITGVGRPKTLCSYFWAVIFALPQMAFVWCAITSAWLFGVDNEYEDGHGKLCFKHKTAFWTALLTLTTILYLVIPYVLFFEAENYEGFLVVGTIVFEIICLVVFAQKLYNVYNEREQPIREGDSFITLTWKMVKATKQKVCPLIHYNE